MVDLENDEAVGFQLISADDIDDYGVTAVIQRIRERVGDSPVYLRYAPLGRLHASTPPPT